MAESKIVINRPSSASTPPNCAICLGSCTNKCFSDSCMHQFCFKCLLEWSKIKAECPLCKQRFKSIIHNVKSNEEYDEHIVETTRNEDVRLISNEEFLFVPLSITPQRHEFHVRTTFTVDSRGEHAIQQMLLSHPLTSGRLTAGTGYPNTAILPRSRFTSHRRSVYENNLWVHAEPDVSGYYRECSPQYFRNNPAARQRLLPWLHRELTALYRDDTRLITHVIDVIMTNILRHHVCSLTFRNSIREYFDVRTDQFVHELYNFLRSPYDMFGYDRSVVYTCDFPINPSPFFDDTVEVPDDNSDDSDVVLVSATNPSEPVTIDLVDTDSDEPIMISSCTEVKVPMPIISPPRRNTSAENSGTTTGQTLVNLPPKLRHKHEAIQDKEKWRWIKKKRARRSSSSSSSSSSDERNKESYKKYKMRKALKKSKHKKRPETINHFGNDSDVNITTSDSDTDDNKPLIDIVKKKWKTKEKKSKKGKRKRSKYEDDLRPRERIVEEPPAQLQPMDLSMDSPSCSKYTTSLSNNPASPEQQRPKSPHQSLQLKLKFEPSTSRYIPDTPKSSRSKVGIADDDQYTLVPLETEALTADPKEEPCSSRTKIRIVRNGRNSPKHSTEKSEPEESGSSAEDYRIPSVKSEIREVKYGNPGPSTSKSLPLVFKREHNKWYVFGESDSSD